MDARSAPRSRQVTSGPNSGPNSGPTSRAKASHAKASRAKSASIGTKGRPSTPDFQKLVDTYSPRIHALARRLTGNPADADDLTQETFTQAFRKWGTFEGRADPGSWLYIITLRLFRKKLRRKKGHEKSLAPESELMPFRDRGIADLPVDALPPINRILDREAMHSLETAIARLPTSFRVPLILKDILELSTEEVAEVTGLKALTVKTRVRRARLALRQDILRHVPKRAAPDPSYPRQVCVDLLAAKLDAMDKGRGFPIGQNVICDRCKAVFAELDLTQSACAALAQGPLPAPLVATMRQIVRAGASTRRP